MLHISRLYQSMFSDIPECIPEIVSEVAASLSAMVAEEVALACAPVFLQRWVLISAGLQNS